MPACGFAWFWPRGDGRSEAGLLVGLETANGRLLTMEEFQKAGVRLLSRHHSGRVQSFDFEFDGAQASLAFMLAGPDALLCQAKLRTPSSSAKLIAQGRVNLTQSNNARAFYLGETDAIAFLRDPGPWYVLKASQPSEVHRILDDQGLAHTNEHVIGAAMASENGRLSGELKFQLASESSQGAEVWFAFGRGSTVRQALAQAEVALQSGGETLDTRLKEDDRFWENAPRPVGDWPGSFRRGWVYDLETTRLMVRPPAGELQDIWPTWRLFWPRIVLAENALDMMRLAPVQPRLAQAALLTAFRDSPKANVPCMFVNGSLNMVAEGGDACGTSPAWCLPYHNIFLLYLWNPDRTWLAELYPYLEAYLDWWIENRTDDEGWSSYRCTWESGEDSSPRLDAEETGHRDIFGEVRPVELQAAMAHSAHIMIELGTELQIPDGRLTKWKAVHHEYIERTRSLWDPATHRFRDSYPGDVPSLDTRDDYWGAPADESPLQLLPLMYQVASPEQMQALAARLMEFNKPPWTSWPSWTYTIVEAARAAGEYAVAGKIAYAVLNTVYARLDRREETEVGARPGTSNEWWPPELSDSNVLNETYGWGATSATLLLRHVFGFGPALDTSAVRFELAPSFSGGLLDPDRRLGFTNLRYRGVTFDLELKVETENMLLAKLVTRSPVEVTVVGPSGQVEVSHSSTGGRFPLRNGQLYWVTLALPS